MKGPWADPQAFFDDVRVGDRYAPSRRRILSQRDIDNWYSFSGDWWGSWSAILSRDEHGAAIAIAEDRASAPALLVLSLHYGLAPAKVRPAGRVAVYQWEEIDHVRPLRVGDAFYYEAEVISKERVSDEYGVVRVRRDIKNQRGELILTQVDKNRYRTRSAWEKLQAGAEPLQTKRRERT